MYIRICMYKYNTHTHTYKHTRTHTHTHTHTHNMYVNVYIFMMYICVCMYMYIYIYVSKYRERWRRSARQQNLGPECGRAAAQARDGGWTPLQAPHPHPPSTDWAVFPAPRSARLALCREKSSLPTMRFPGPPHDYPPWPWPGLRSPAASAAHLRRPCPPRPPPAGPLCVAQHGPLSAAAPSPFEVSPPSYGKRRTKGVNAVYAGGEPVLAGDARAPFAVPRGGRCRARPFPGAVCCRVEGGHRGEPSHSDTRHVGPRGQRPRVHS